MAFSLTSSMDLLKKMPMYKPFLKTVLKSQIKLLVEQLCEYGDEESVFLTASVTDGTLSHIGSKSGQVFLESNEDIKLKFLEFCIAGGTDSNQSKSSEIPIQKTQKHKKVNKKRQPFSRSQLPTAKRCQTEATSEPPRVVCADSDNSSGDNLEFETNTLKCEKDGHCLAKVNNEKIETNEANGDDKADFDVRKEVYDNKDAGLDSVHDSADNSNDAVSKDIIFIKMEPDWEDDSEDDSEEEKTNAEDNTETTSDMSSSNVKSPAASRSGKTAAHLKPEFLCCNDDLIWEKNSLPKQKRVVKSSSLRTKYSAIKEVEQQKKSKAAIAKEFGIPRSTLSTWLKHSEKIKADIEDEKIDPNKKKRRFSNFFDIEEALLEWLKIVHLQAVIPKITSVNICDKANQLARQFGYTPETFQCSSAWVERFKTRHGFKKNFVKGESCSGH